MANETFPHYEHGVVVASREDILLQPEETINDNWPVQEIRFNRKNCILIVDVDEPGLVERIVDQPALLEFSELGFRPKEGLHMTVIGYENGGQILETLKPLPPDEQEELLSEVTAMAKNMNWSWRPTGDLHRFRGRKKKGLKIISRVECPAFNHFYRGLGQLMPAAKFELYPPHVTLLKQPGVAETVRQAPLSVGGVALSRPILSLNHPTIEG